MMKINVYERDQITRVKWTSSKYVESRFHSILRLTGDICSSLVIYTCLCNAMFGFMIILASSTMDTGR